ncbi:alpha/beta fold hydrolase [Lyngbya sp. PCC 8106]|uniref:alpha/beta fold hydrolase n=1 Tax=Lyngbya sp. (strain PCC 8106) TaxID=313612 RepID=UPI0000EAD948|nr:alpha/beta hydrolase [Lyngbya sp. PCC 8106]EAW34913.1 Alpha/beta hydrolase fold protein [Lyngbya sp. PCC 8106]
MFEQIHHSRIKLSQGQIFWREAGYSDLNLVFLHGAWQDGSQWLPVFEHLCGEYRCFAPDLLGCGESEFPNIHYSIDLMVESLAEYLNLLKLEDVCLVGHSLGGWIAASFALKYPERVRRLILISPEGVKASDQEGRWRWRRWLAHPPAPLHFILKLIYPFAVIIGQGKKVKQTLQQRQQMLNYVSASRLLFKRRWAEYRSELLDERLSNLRAPVLILQATHDQAIALSMSESYSVLAPMADLKFVKPGGENLPAELPDVIAQYIREFIAGYLKVV